LRKRNVKPKKELASVKSRVQLTTVKIRSVRIKYTQPRHALDPSTISILLVTRFLTQLMSVT
jgi:hypothetical protein